MRRFTRSGLGEVDTRRVLGTVYFGAPADQPKPGSGISLQLPLDPLESAACADMLLGAAASRRERIGAVDVATDGRLAFGCVQVDEASAGGLRAAAEHAYASIFAALERCTCAHPLRFWNYVPRINDMLDGLERYRHFNVGRQAAFLAAQRAAFVGAPAACAIGTDADTLTIYFIAADAAPVPVENPRQVSAYHYPAEYGPRAPTFSRATVTAGSTPQLFVSGTASIVGHRSQHPGDPAAQTRETFANLRTLVAAANAKLPAPAFALDRLLYTVYVRQPSDLESVRHQFLNEVGAQSAAAQYAIFLRGDICRAELLVEIEATALAT